MQGLMDGVIPAEPATYELVRREAARLGRLVTDVERLSRIEAGVEANNPDALSPIEAVESVIAPLRPQFAHSQIELTAECREPCPKVWADPDKFAQILGNLLSNALRFTPAGGSVRVGVEPRDTMVAFVVEDNGIGIPASDLPHVFERFYRVDKSRSGAGGGSGIGLAIARQLTQQMGGSIQAESVPGSYTRFSFLLPRA
jgi:signal transduction histidine kinase